MPEPEHRISSLKTVKTFLKLGTCSEALVYVLNRAYDRENRLEERSSIPLAGGIFRRGFQCGMLWGATLAAGAEIFSRYGAGSQSEALAIEAAKRLIERFRSSNGAVNCRELTHTDWKSPAKIVLYFLKGGPYKCVRMSARYANEALHEIDGFLTDNTSQAPDAPLSCAAETARRLGASEMQCTIAAGFAGGIGLSGAACGALGAALWLLAMEFERQGVKDIWTSEDFSARAETLISRFLEASGGKMECAEICRKEFASVADHAEYLRNGGCAAIMAALTDK